MQIFINQTLQLVPENCSLIDALNSVNATPPFAIALNQQFIPKNEYSSVTLQEKDQIEIISPITGG